MKENHPDTAELFGPSYSRGSVNESQGSPSRVFVTCSAELIMMFRIFTEG